MAEQTVSVLPPQATAPTSTLIHQKIPGGNELLNPKKVLEDGGIVEGMTVADLGSGMRGYFSLQAAKLVGKNGTVYAVDILKSALQSVENFAKLYNLTNVKTVWSNLEVVGATNIPEKSIDAGLLVNILFQIGYRANVIKEAGRLIKQKGMLLVVDWKKELSPLGPPLESRLLQDEIKKLVQAENFSFEKEFSAGPYHYGLVFKKQ
ncbi:MAG: methyltransferase domain-containing protein [Parcubacteria group bacterium]|nr:methyltransferase domain-containing protein [Parcubacteria group bacterium]